MEPARRSMKRKHYEVLKNDLAVELTNLTNDSGNLHNDLRSANEDFVLMCRSMADRQADLLTRSLFLEEKYGEVIGLVDGKPRTAEEETTGENVVLPTAYTTTFHRFVTDSNNSLKDHAILMEQEQKDMVEVFEKYDEIWKENLNVFKERIEKIAAARTKLSGRLVAFRNCDVEDSDSD